MVLELEWSWDGVFEERDSPGGEAAPDGSFLKRQGVCEVQHYISHPLPASGIMQVCYGHILLSCVLAGWLHNTLQPVVWCEQWLQGYHAGTDVLRMLLMIAQ